MNIYDKLLKNGWTKIDHTILGKKRSRYHKDGFELPDYLIDELL